MVKNVVNLRYLGTSARFVDDKLGLVFEAGGEAHKVSEEDAVRIRSANRREMWELLSDAQVADEAKAKAAAEKAAHDEILRQIREEINESREAK